VVCLGSLFTGVSWRVVGDFNGDSDRDLTASSLCAGEG
jgi:hypothetical protein